ncbi:MAG: SCO family protein [Acetobacteraceae bacterium]|nr:SCO family protein [Acetobacteraceae bacterium]
MLTRRTLMWAAPAAVVAGGAGLSGYMLLHRSPGHSPGGIGGPFTLVDGSGKTVTDADFAGKWMLVYFGYTHCPDACPTALQDMANAVDMLDPAQRKKVAIVFITVDPARDTPAVMRDYVSNFAAPIVPLSGSPEQIAKAAKEYRVYYAKHPTEDGYEMDHSSIIYVMNPEGDFVANFTHESSPKQIAAKLHALV